MPYASWARAHFILQVYLGLPYIGAPRCGYSMTAAGASIDCPQCCQNTQLCRPASSHAACRLFTAAARFVVLQTHVVYPHSTDRSSKQPTQHRFGLNACLLDHVHANKKLPCNTRNHQCPVECHLDRYAQHDGRAENLVRGAVGRCPTRCCRLRLLLLSLPAQTTSQSHGFGTAS